MTGRRDHKEWRDHFITVKFSRYLRVPTETLEKLQKRDEEGAPPWAWTWPKGASWKVPFLSWRELKRVNGIFVIPTLCPCTPVSVTCVSAGTISLKKWVMLWSTMLHSINYVGETGLYFMRKPFFGYWSDVVQLLCLNFQLKWFSELPVEQIAILVTKLTANCC